LFSVGLLVKRAGRVSFSHEMIQNACVAFDLARVAAVDPAAFGPRLSTPILEPIAGDVIAAIEDGSVCRGVLQEVMSSSLLAGAASGRFGPIAALPALELLTEAADTCVDEIRNARLTLSKEGDAVRIGWEEGTKRQWSVPEEARLQAIGRRAAMGPGIDVFLSLCAEMDARAYRSRGAHDGAPPSAPLRPTSLPWPRSGGATDVPLAPVLVPSWLPSAPRSCAVRGSASQYDRIGTVWSDQHAPKLMSVPRHMT
jgi:hypothetical protein